MALMKRPANDLDWPAWFGRRRFMEWPDLWGDMSSELKKIPIART
jgi:hypothetical protein